MGNEIDRIITEEYIGKIPEFEAVSKLFDHMIMKARKNPDTINPNKWKENAEICHIFKKFFGLKNFYLYWVPSSVRNAFTFTDSLFRAGENYKGIMERKKGRGFYDTNHECIFYVMGYCSLFHPSANFTGKELTAIFLHEIGHNFDYGPSAHINVLMRMYLNLRFRNDDVTEQHNDMKFGYAKYYKKEGEYLYNNPEDREMDRKKDENRLRKYLNSPAFFNFIRGTVYLGINTFYLLSGLAVLSQLSLVKGRQGEQFADSFATTYGYGNELIQALEKLSDYKNYITRNHTPDKLVRGYLNAQLELMSLYGDVHGSDQARCADAIEKLKSDLKTGDYPEDMKKDLLHDIAELKKTYDAIVNCSPEERVNFVRGWRKFVDVIFKGRPEILRIFKPNRM